MITAQAAAQKWAANLAAATTSIKNGVQAVTVSPTAKAAQNLQGYLNGVQAAVSSGRMAAALNSVTLSSWQNDMITKGVPRVASGATAAVPKMTTFMSKWLPAMQQIQASLSSMPRGTLDQNIARAVSVMQQAAALKGTMT